MAGTKAGAKLARQNMINDRFGGSEELYKSWIKEIAAKGGRIGRTGGFAANHELARIAGAKGGRISKRKPKNV